MQRGGSKTKNTHSLFHPFILNLLCHDPNRQVPGPSIEKCDESEESHRI